MNFALKVWISFENEITRCLCLLIEWYITKFILEIFVIEFRFLWFCKHCLIMTVVKVIAIFWLIRNKTQVSTFINYQQSVFYINVATHWKFTSYSNINVQTPKSIYVDLGGKKSQFNPLKIQNQISPDSPNGFL